MLKRKKLPSNYLPMGETGWGLWTIWCDDGPGTRARFYQNYLGASAKVFLRDDEARNEAQELARKNPDQRFCVKKHHA